MQSTGGESLNMVRHVEERLGAVNQEIVGLEQRLLQLRGSRDELLGILRSQKPEALQGKADAKKEASSAALLTSTTPVNDRLPAHPVWRQVFAILLEHPNGLYFRDLFEKAKARGIKIPGQNPLGNLSTQLSRAEHLERVGKGVYRFK